MKRFTILAMALLLAIPSIWGQTKGKIVGKYNGEDILIEYTILPGDRKRVDNIRYAKFTKLQSEVTTLTKQKAELEKQIESLKKENNNLRKGESTHDSSSQINNLQQRINLLTDEIAQKNDDVSAIRDSLRAMTNQLNASRSNCSDTIEHLLRNIESLQLKLGGKSINRDALHVSAMVGASWVSNDMVKQSAWSLQPSNCNTFAASWLHYFSNQSPFAIKAGISLSFLGGSASLALLHDTVYGLTDVDGDSYNELRTFRNIDESVRFSYVELPILLHIGNNYNDMGIQGWAELGVRASIAIGSSFQGQGQRTIKGFYPAWNVVLNDIDALGFVTDKPIYNDASAPNKICSFVLWGQLSFGIYVPAGTHFGINVGLNAAYSLLPVSKGTDAADGTRVVNGAINITDGGNTRILALAAELGLSYKF